jgi:hypothetical protein
MIFTTNRRFAKPSEPPIAYVESPMMTFSNKYRKHVMILQMQQQQQQLKPLEREASASTFASTEPIDPKKKPMKWGEPTWFLFHTLAEKIKPEYYPEIRKELLNLIYTICSNLPCPNCAKHAVDYLNAMNFNTLTTKDSLRMMLYNFHNEVNRRKRFPEFPLEQLSAKYSAANTVNIIHNFMPYFEDRTGSVRLIADNLHRSRVALQLKAWFNKNIGYFEL